MTTHGHTSSGHDDGARHHHEAHAGHNVRRGAGVSALDALFALGIVAISAGAYVLGIAPARAAAMGDSQAREQLVKLDAQKRKVAEDFRTRRAVRDSAAAALEGSVRLVPETEINARRAAIASLADQASLRIQATRPLATLRGRRFDLVPIEIDGVGTATDFARFAAALRERLPDTAIRSFELSTDGSEASHRFTAHLVWYTLPEAMARGGARANGAGGNGARSAAEAGDGDDRSIAPTNGEEEMP